MLSTHHGRSKWSHVVVLVTLTGLGFGAASKARAQAKSADTREADQMFQNLDANRDGRLKMDEAEPNGRALMERIFEMAGKPAGGTVSRAEFQTVFEKHKAGAGGGGRGRPNTPPGRPNAPAAERPDSDEPSPADGDELPPILAQLDGNGDGRLTRAELQRLTQLFERLDANKDGALTADEIRSIDNLSRPESKSKTSNKTPRTGSRSSAATAADDAEQPEEKAASEPTPKTKTDGRNAARSIPAGVWRGWIVNGRGENPNSGQMEIELTVEGNRITGRELGTRRAPEGIGGGTFTSTGDGRTGNLDAEGTSGPQDGRSFQGIYEYDGEVLKWCVSNRGRQRPQTMATDRGNYLMVLRQQK